MDSPDYHSHSWCQLCQTLGGMYRTVTSEESIKKKCITVDLIVSFVMAPRQMVFKSLIYVRLPTKHFDQCNMNICIHRSFLKKDYAASIVKLLFPDLRKTLLLGIFALLHIYSLEHTPRFDVRKCCNNILSSPPVQPCELFFRCSWFS